MKEFLKSAKGHVKGIPKAASDNIKGFLEASGIDIYENLFVWLLRVFRNSLVTALTAL
jgi:hypothetical protein